MSQTTKYVVFRLNHEEYGLNIDQVLSIERMKRPTPLPKMPEYIVGVIDLRGIVIPVIDFKKALLDEYTEVTDSTRIIVTNLEGQLTGFIVDETTDIEEVQADQIQTPKLSTDSSQSSFTNGVAHLNERLLILVNLEEFIRHCEETLSRMALLNGEAV